MKLTVNHIIKEWPSAKAFAESVTAQGVAIQGPAASRWARCGSIPSKALAAVLDAARARGIDLSAEELIAALDGRER